MNYFRMINESTKKPIYEGNADEIYKLGEINIMDIKRKKIVKVKTGDIIRVVNDAMFYMQKKHDYLNLFIKTCKLMYIPILDSEICDTMCVDDRHNLWINLHFVYNTCDMNREKVFGILFHELFHIFLQHILRFNKMFPESSRKIMSNKDLKTLNKITNIAMDYEINASMVADGIVSKDFWKTMNGLYKKEYTGNERYNITIGNKVLRSNKYNKFDKK